MLCQRLCSQHPGDVQVKENSTKETVGLANPNTSSPCGAIPPLLSCPDGCTLAPGRAVVHKSIVNSASPAVSILRQRRHDPAVECVTAPTFSEMGECQWVIRGVRGVRWLHDFLGSLGESQCTLRGRGLHLTECLTRSRHHLSQKVRGRFAIAAGAVGFVVFGLCSCTHHQ